MKLRIKGNSLRFRLTRSEIGALGSGNSVREEIAFVSGTNPKLSYVVRPEAGLSRIEVGFDGAEICVRIPDWMGRALSETDRVGIEEELPAYPHGSIEVKIEKDFECLSPRSGEDDSDTFPHPEYPIKSEHGT